MTTALRLRRGTTSQHSTFTGADGEVTVDSTKKTVVVHDGSTAGGSPLLKENNPSYTGTLTGGTGAINIGSGQLVKDSSGNLGLGVTPSAWSTLGGAALEITQQGNGLSANPNAFYYSANAYFASDNWRYAKTGYATQYYVNSNAGSHVWQIAPSGTAGNAITFTQAMTLDASGRLLIGGTYATQNAPLNVFTGGSAGRTSITGYDITGNTTVNTVNISDGNGGAICLIRGYEGSGGQAYSRLYLLAIKVSGGGGADVTAVTIASTGVVGPAFSFGSSGGKLQVTSTGTNGGFGIISFIGL